MSKRSGFFPVGGTAAVRLVNSSVTVLCNVDEASVR